MFVHFISNLLFISIFEEAFLLAVVLILLKKEEYLKPKLKNLVRGIKCIIVPCIVVNVLRYYTALSINQILLIFSFMLFFAIIITYQITKFSNIIKIYIFVIMSIILLQISEIYVPYVLMKLNRSLEDLKQSILFCFLMTIPQRCMHAIILYTVLFKKFDDIKVNIIDLIFKERKNTVVVISTLVGTLIYMFAVNKWIYQGKILEYRVFLVQIIVIVLLFCIPMLLIFITGAYLYNKKKNLIIDLIETNLIIELNSRNKMGLEYHGIEVSQVMNPLDDIGEHI